MKTSFTYKRFSSLTISNVCELYLLVVTYCTGVNHVVDTVQCFLQHFNKKSTKVHHYFVCS